MLRRRRRASWAKPSGAAATTQASGVSLVSLVAGRSQEAADSGQSTTARTVPPPARQAVLKDSAAARDASSRLWPTDTVSMRDPGYFSSPMSAVSSASVCGDGSGRSPYSARSEAGIRGERSCFRSLMVSMAEALSRFCFQRAYVAGRHTAQGRYPAVIAVVSSGKKTRCAT
ncbi:hypothetical protein [Streptomyces sp. NPDC002922]|uniref:hypothetical protein n=1 Tax=Streptomyces sp. NPDC002922 TaxID=3154439 RepID=UPI0033A7CC1C